MNKINSSTTNFYNRQDMSQNCNSIINSRASFLLDLEILQNINHFFASGAHSHTHFF